jgi:tripeptide aminopeptidase
LSSNEIPQATEGYEGFFHLHTMEGTVEKTTLEYIIRDHDMEVFEERKNLFHKIAGELNSRIGNELATVEIRDQYYNMREKIESVMHIVDLAEEAMKELGIKPLIKAIRGGTDGSQLSYKGLPCPNIFAGGHNFHGRYEYVPVESMQKAVDVIVKIAELTAKKYT